MDTAVAVAGVAHLSQRCVCVCVCVCMYMCVQRGAHTDVRAHTLVCTGTTVRMSLPLSDMCSHPLF